MDDVLLVRRVQRERRLSGDVDGRRDRKAALTPQQIAQRPADEVFEDEIGADPRLDAEVVDPDDVRVFDARERERLALEALDRVHVREEVAADDLEGGVALQVDVLRPIDRALTADPEPLLDAVFALDHATEEGIRQCQRPAVIRTGADSVLEQLLTRRALAHREVVSGQWSVVSGR